MTFVRGTPCGSSSVNPPQTSTRSLFSRLTQRCRLPEVMDDPALDAHRHIQALRGLERINYWSGSVRIVWSPIHDLARKEGARSLRILDIATGAGDVPIGLWQQARRIGLSLEIDGCDCSPTAVEYARRRAEHVRANVSFFKLDALTDQLPLGYDVILCSLFLHHLDDDEAVHLLWNMAQAAGRMVLVNDLVRNVPGLVLAHVGTRALSTSDVVHTDGPRSVLAAYTINEVWTLAQRAGLDGIVVSHRWPYRFLLIRRGGHDSR